MIENKYFEPAFGNRPSSMIGRDAEIKNIVNGLSTKPSSRERASLIVAQRGYGKTALLLEIADKARERGFVVAFTLV